MNKLYCYIDETGQDTKGKLFLVAIVIVDGNREAIIEKLEVIEKSSKKGIRKWFHTNKHRREDYLKRVFNSGLFEGSIFYSVYKDSGAYVDLTIFSAAKAVLQKAVEPYRATVLVDGLNKYERHRFGAGLRKLRVKVKKVRGVRDQSDALIRLADAIAGFIRDYLEGDQVMKELYDKASKSGIIRQV